MKIVACLFICIVLVSCKNEIDSAEVLKETSTTDRAIEKQAEKKVSSKIPIVNYTELESMYLSPDDTSKTYVINFWATWCKPCVKELPFFEALHAKYASKNVEVVLVSLDFPENIDKQVVPFIKKHELKSEIILLDDPDANSWIPKVSANWSGAIPATVIIREKNRNFYEQSFTYDELETELKSILNK